MAASWKICAKKCFLQASCFQKCQVTHASRYIQRFVIPKEQHDADRLDNGSYAQALLESLAARGFCRPRPSYSPPDDIRERIIAICSEFGLTPNDSVKNSTEIDAIKLSSSTTKFKVLTRCMKEFSHDIPNTELNSMRTLGDVIKYFSTSVDGRSPYEQLVAKQDQLPENLHVIPKGIRFHPKTDTMFNGVSAYPGSSTIVSGLRAKKKYKGFNASRHWPFTID